MNFHHLTFGFSNSMLNWIWVECKKRNHHPFLKLLLLLFVKIKSGNSSNLILQWWLFYLCFSGVNWLINWLIDCLIYIKNMWLAFLFSLICLVHVLRGLLYPVRMYFIDCVYISRINIKEFIIPNFLCLVILYTKIAFYPLFTLYFYFLPSYNYSSKRNKKNHNHKKETKLASIIFIFLF